MDLRLKCGRVPLLVGQGGYILLLDGGVYFSVYLLGVPENFAFHWQFLNYITYWSPSILSACDD